MIKHPYRLRLLGGSLLAALTLGALGTAGMWAQGTGNEPMSGMDMGPTPMPGMNLGPTPTPGSAAPPTPSSGPAAMPAGMSWRNSDERVDNAARHDHDAGYDQAATAGYGCR